MKELVFVYGTLKRDGHNYPVMQKARGTFQYNALTRPYYDLLNLGGFPGLIHGKHRIVGEVFLVENIIPIDFLEGYPTFYDRRKIAVDAIVKPSPATYFAWAYHLNDRNTEYKETKIPGFNGVKQWSNTDDKRNTPG